MVEATLLFTGNYDVSLLSSMRFAYLTGHPRALPLRRIEITEHVSTIVNSETTSLARRWLAIKNCFQHIPAISSHVPAIATTFISTRIRQSSMKPVTKGHVIFCELPWCPVNSKYPPVRFAKRFGNFISSYVKNTLEIQIVSFAEIVTSRRCVSIIWVNEGKYSKWLVASSTCISALEFR